MSNILHLQTKLLPIMLTKFEALYGLKSVDDKDMLQQIIGQVDEVLFEDYLKRKRETLQQITDMGLLGPGVDPLTEVRPKGEPSSRTDNLVAEVEN
jgi:exocyst complex component 2